MPAMPEKGEFEACPWGMTTPSEGSRRQAGASSALPVPPGTPPVATIMPGKSTISGVVTGYRRGNVFLCLQGVLYRNLCRRSYVPYDDGQATPFEITGTNPYGFAQTREIRIKFT